MWVSDRVCVVTQIFPAVRYSPTTLKGPVRGMQVALPHPTPSPAPPFLLICPGRSSALKRLYILVAKYSLKSSEVWRSRKHKHVTFIGDELTRRKSRERLEA